MHDLIPLIARRLIGPGIIQMHSKSSTHNFVRLAGPIPITNVKIENIGSDGCACFIQWIVLRTVMKSSCYFYITNSRSKIKTIVF